MVKINLVEAPAGKELTVLELESGLNARKRLISMGIHTGDKLVKTGNSNWCPVLVQNVTLNSSKIAIGNRLASKIMVEYDETET
jgi:Fe2+ transport system protein FeoA